MKNLKEIIEMNDLANTGVEFVVMTHSKTEYEQMRDTIFEAGLCFIVFNPEITEREAMDDLAEDYDYDGGWRISWGRGVAFNPDIKHWQEYGYTILETKETGKLGKVDY